MQQDFDDRYELRQGGPGLQEDGTPDAATIGHIDAVSLGFLEPSPDAAAVTEDVESHIADHEVVFDVYRRHPVPGSLDEASPVGTFGTLPKELSWGDGSAVNTMAITSVTVRATDRRRGILRRMMTTALDWAVAEGIPMASLTASEGTIYRRFGFGPAIRERAVTIKTSRALPLLVPTSGEVVVVPPALLREHLAREVFDRFHSRTIGSMVRNTRTWARVLGQAGGAKEPDRAVRAAIHRDGEHTDGYVSYKFHEEHGKPTRLEILDLIAATEQAYLALWEFLLSTDLVDQVEYPFARIDDPIVHVLADNRAFDIDHEEDHVWLRVLDVAAVLASRPYAVDGSVELRVADAQGYASGTWRLDVLEGRGTVARTAAPSDVAGSSTAGHELGGADGAGPDGSGTLSLDVSTLGSLLLGAVDPVVLHDVGLVGGDPDAAALLGAMLRPARQPHGMTYF